VAALAFARRIPLEASVPHPTTLMKLTTRCGAGAVAGLNETLLAKASEAKLVRTAKLGADTTVVPSNVSYAPDSGCWRRRCGASRAETAHPVRRGPPPPPTGRSRPLAWTGSADRGQFGRTAREVSAGRTAAPGPWLA
jgi:hypothetical protein